MRWELGFPVVTEPKVIGLLLQARSAVSGGPQGGKEICSATVGDKLQFPGIDLLNGLLLCFYVSPVLTAGTNSELQSEEE